MGCCLPYNRSNNLISSNFTKKDLKNGTKIFNMKKDDDEDDENFSKKSQNENKNEIINNIIDTNNINNNIKQNKNNNQNTKTLKLSKNQPITTNINNINININQISKNSEVKSNGTEKNNNNENANENGKQNEEAKIVKAVLNIDEKQNLKEIFSNHFLFKNKSAQLILSIIDSLEMMIIKKDVTLFEKGDKGYYFYVIQEGKIELLTEYGVKTLNENDTFGELALIQNKKRTASAKALENCKLLLLNGKKFREIILEKTETDFKERMNILSASPIFSSLDNNKLNAIATGLICCSFEPNQKILYKGDIGQSIYIIKSGKVKCLNGEQEIRFLGPKDYFGEGSILFNMNRSLTIHVEETTECYQLSESFLNVPEII